MVTVADLIRDVLATSIAQPEQHAVMWINVHGVPHWKVTCRGLRGVGAQVPQTYGGPIDCRVCGERIRGAQPWWQRGCTALVPLAWWREHAHVA